MSLQDRMPAAGPEPGPGRSLTIPLRYPSGTGITLATGISVGITWQYIPPEGTWPLAVLGAVAMICDTLIIAIRTRRRTG
ncbi:hypothetical protein [Streptomyces sp. NBC_01353]|uniref:hypothetical protein n=1 Tax=Streptomyces sp. NBC_01353 TaxID=2903835 RepID=UPI002E306675|nr:hypothetical protein [Streptomyces sp. NBC_01353]